MVGANCGFCNGNDFVNHREFKGTTNYYQNKSFTYAQCNNCKSISNLTLKEVNYKKYVTGTTISKLKANRFKKLLEKLRIDKGSKMLDYGCGNGALVKALRNKGYVNTQGYEPFGEKHNKTISKAVSSSKKYDLVFMTHVFEHIPDYWNFFSDLRKITTKHSKIVSIHPSATRFPGLDPNCPFQSWAIHAPFHASIPSDEATVGLFASQGFKLKFLIPYDVQRSGIKDNNNVSALLSRSLGGTKEALLEADLTKKITCALKSPISFSKAMFLDTRDRLVSTFVFERI